MSKKNQLHPIQEAMVKFHGSQCGFCTPGFIMSLFAMYKNFKKFDDEVIEETLSGNLCRCTGYRPIIDAAKSLNNKKDNQLYIGKANNFGNRVKENSSRVAMPEFDSFLFFELHPEYSFLLNEIENYSIRLFASIFSNMVKVKGLDLDKMKLVNKQIKK